MAQLLVVEDDERIRTALIRALRDRGHAVSSAGTALDGLRQAVDERPDARAGMEATLRGLVAGEDVDVDALLREVDG